MLQEIIYAALKDQKGKIPVHQLTNQLNQFFHLIQYKQPPLNQKQINELLTNQDEFDLIDNHATISKDLVIDFEFWEALFLKMINHQSKPEKTQYWIIVNELLLAVKIDIEKQTLPASLPENIIWLNTQPKTEGLFKYLLNTPLLNNQIFGAIFRLMIRTINDSTVPVLQEQIKNKLSGQLDHLVFRPSPLNNLITKIAAPEDDTVIWEPESGDLSTITEIIKQNNTTKAYTQFRDDKSLTLGKLNLLLHNHENNIKDIQLSSFGDNNFIADAFCNLAIALTIPAKQRNEKEEDQLIRLICRKLSKNGHGIMLVADKFLYRLESVSLREELIRHDWIEAIIDLPEQFIQTQQLKNYSLLLINKNKQTSRRGAILLMHVKKQQQLSDNNIFAHFTESLVEILHHNKNDESHQSFYYKWQINKELDKEKKLLPIHYVHPVFKTLNDRKQKGETFSKLRALCALPPSNTTTKASGEYLIIRREHLQNDPLDYMIDTTLLPIDTPAPLSKRVDEPVLLLNTSLSLKPSYLEPGDQNIFVNRDIHLLKPDFNRIDLDYLMIQLHATLIQEQLSAKKKDQIFITDILSLEIPVPAKNIQLKKVAEYKDEKNSRHILTNFIQNIRLVSNHLELKHEIEQFTRQYLPEDTLVEYKTSLEFEDFPFDVEDLAKHNYFKFSIHSQKTSILLISPDEKILGVIVTDHQGEITQKTYAEINAYAHFLIKLKEHVTQQVANDNLARFAHTSKNFFTGLQGEIKSLINPNNPVLKKVLDEEFVEDEDFIQHKIRKDKVDKQEFLAINKLNNISKRLSEISNFYIKTDQTFKNIINSDFTHFDLLEDLKKIHEITGRFDLQSKTATAKVFGKKEAIIQAFVDLIQNAVYYCNKNIPVLKVKSHQHFIGFSLENQVDDLMGKEKYNSLGRKWFRNDKGNASSGIYWAFQSIEDSYGLIWLDDYQIYSVNKRFVVHIKLPQ